MDEALRRGDTAGVVMTGTGWPEQSFLGRLSAQDREPLLELGVRHVMHPGQIILLQGEQSRHVVILLDGYAKVTAATADHQEALLDIRGRGDIVGELAAMSGADRSATVTACGRVVGRRLAHRMFEEFLDNHPAATRHLTASVGDKLVWSDRRRADFIGLAAPARVARVLHDLAAVFGTAEPAVRVAVTQTELASMAGTRSVTVHKILRDLRDAGVVATGYGHITVLSGDRLRELGDVVTDES